MPYNAPEEDKRLEIFNIQFAAKYACSQRISTVEGR